ncbi:ATP-grasp domain-containing protein [Roseobacter weihaiensis]|uniref:ATP-grasp domain-containing protein n=1 Tax=Roseobacter weihaiensis TaxID=2763262 RepID=UPI001D0BDF67|nr:ATP-grasp domain-containing protein [Roseobacter sp. H9]
MAKTICLVLPRPRHIEVANDLGVECITVHDELSYKGLPASISIVVPSIADVASDAVAGAVKALAGDHELCGAISFSERGLRLASQISDSLSLDSANSTVVDRIVDKHEMRKTITCSASPVWSMIYNVDMLHQFLNSLAGDVILKPSDGVGSYGVVRISKNKPNPSILDTRFPALAEEFLDGQEYSAETISHNGSHKIVAITRKLAKSESIQNAFVETGHTVARSFLEDAAFVAKVESLVFSSLDQLELKFGVAHTEFIDTREGLKIVETHNRTGGDKIADLVNLVTGVDLVAAAMKSFTVTDLSISSTSTITARAATIKFFLPPSGVITNILGLSRLRYNPGIREFLVNKSVGDRVLPIMSSGDRAGYVIAVGDSADTSEELAAEAVGMVEFKIQSSGST